MAVRKFPYGYVMVKGRIIIEEPEAEIIRSIFKARADGKSNWEIGKVLYAEGYEYFSDTVKKNSCKISAIIYDSRYTGADGYPPIVDKDLFDKVQTMKGKAYCEGRKLRSSGGRERSRKDESPTSTILIPSRVVFEKEKALKTMLQRDENDEYTADTDAIKQMIFDIAAEKYGCIS